MNGWVAIARMDARNGNIGVGGFEAVDRIGGGGVEGDDFSANGQVIAVRWSACFQATIGAGSLTSSAPKRTYQQPLLRLSARSQCPIGPEAVRDWRASFRARHRLQIEMVIL